MAGVRSWWANKDWDSILSYDTFKVVKVKDARLGGLLWFFRIIILIYVFVIDIGWKKGYLEVKSPTSGTIRTSLRAPGEGDDLPSDPSQLSYCTDTTLCEERENCPLMNCIYQDRFGAVYPVLEANSAFVTTRLSQTVYDLGGDYAAAGCPPDRRLANTVECLQLSKANGTSVENFMVDIEQFSLLVQHTVTSSDIGLHQELNEMKGTLIFEDSDREIETDVGDHPAIGDFYPIQTWLEAAGVDSLDDQAEYEFTDAFETWRYAGVTLLVDINYENRESRPSELKFEYRVSRVEGAEFKAEEVTYQDGSWTVNNRHGIRLIFVQTGQLGVLSVRQFFLTFLSGLVLFRFSVLLVELLMLHFLPQKDKYNEIKFEVKDVDDLDDEESELAKAPARETIADDEVAKHTDATGVQLEELSLRAGEPESASVMHQRGASSGEKHRTEDGV